MRQTYHPFPALISSSPISPAPSLAGSRPAATHPSSPPTSPARQGRACPPQEGKLPQLHLMLHPHIRLPAKGGSPTPSPTRWTAPPPPPIPARVSPPTLAPARGSLEGLPAVDWRATPSKSCIVTRQDRIAIIAKYHICFFFAIRPSGHAFQPFPRAQHPKNVTATIGVSAPSSLCSRVFNTLLS